MKSWFNPFRGTDFAHYAHRAVLLQAAHSLVALWNHPRSLEAYAPNSSEVALVVLDLIMPVMGGKECLHELARMDHGVKTIVSIGHSDSEDSGQIPDGSISGSVKKPYGVRQLLETVRWVLDASPSN